MFKSTKAWKTMVLGRRDGERLKIWAVRGVQLSGTMSIKMEKKGGRDWLTLNM